MKLYIKFLISDFLKSFFYVFLIILSLILVLNILNEVEFFRNKEVRSLLPIYMSILNAPDLIFEMFPFIFLLSTQIFFINLFNNNQIHIFKYSGLKNLKILSVISVLTFFIGIMIVIFFYNFSSTLKGYYLELKSRHSADDRYLAVVTKNGLWMKDIVDEQILIINASEIKDEFIVNVFISVFDEDYKLIKNLKSKKINIVNKNWVLKDVIIFENYESKIFDQIILKTNFDSKIVRSLYSNLSSLSIFKLIELKKNYKKLNYSTTEIDIQLYKIFTYPLYMVLITILSASIMFNTKKFKSSTFKITLGLFLSVVIYYLNNFFNVMGNTEKLTVLISIWTPLILIAFSNLIMTFKINEK
tara:strand:+ start:1312 stop:2385 length:1074 start_codon:yes stop_codon:yes gene_type:complete